MDPNEGGAGSTPPRRRDLQLLRRIAARRRSVDPLSDEYRELTWLEQELIDRLRGATVH